LTTFKQNGNQKLTTPDSHPVYWFYPNKPETGGKEVLEVVDLEYIRKKHYVEGWSIRKLNRQLGYARQTIRKALASSAIPQYQLENERPCPVMDPYREVISAWLEADQSAPKKQRHTAKRIYDRLVEEYSFNGSDSAVRKYVRKLRTNYQEVYIPLTADHGEQAQADWGRAKVMFNGILTEVCLFCLKLKACKVPFVWAFHTEKLEAFLEGHKLAFDWLGGIPKEIVYDNLKTAVLKILSGPRRQEHEIFSSLKAHYLFDSIFCRPGEAHEKGSVEGLVGYVRRNTMVPILDLPDIDYLNHQILLPWCIKERQKYQNEWELEKQALLKLPAYHFRTSITKMVKASSYSLVTHDKVRYSVPCRYIGEPLRLEVFASTVEVWHKSRLLATHNRCYETNALVMELDHYLDVLERKPRAVMHAAVVRRLPLVYAAAKQALLKDNPSGYKELCRILLLNRDYPADRVTRALEEALSLGIVSELTVKQLILNQNSVSIPAAEVPVALSGYQVPAFDYGCYDKLLEVTP
jgi:transposase